MQEQKTKVAGFILAIMCLSMMSAMLVAMPETGMAQAPGEPWIVIGQVTYAENDTGVNGATVRATRVLSGLFEEVTTNATGWYLVDVGSLLVTSGNIVTFSATKGALVGSESYTVDFDEEAWVNISIDEPSISLFTVTFFAYNGTSGLGIEAVIISVVNAVGDVINYSTNATGHVEADLPIGAYTYHALTGIAGLYNQTGTFTLSSLGLSVNIDMTQVPIDTENPRLFGLSMSRTFLVILVVIFAVILGLLFVQMTKKEA